MAAVLHNPVFFTHSLLDKPPADPDAIGLVTESPETSLDDLHRQVVAASVTTAGSGGGVTANYVLTTRSDGQWLYATPNTAPADYQWNGTLSVPNTWDWSSGTLIIRPAVPAAEHQENDSMEKELELAQAKLETAETKLETAEAAVTELTTAKAGLEQELATAQNEAKDLGVKVTELETAREALVAQLETATAKITEHETTIASLTGQLDAYKAAEAEKAVAEKLAARIAALPEEFRKAHAKKDEAKRKEVEARWAKKTDEEWAEYVEDLLGYVPTKVGFVRLSQEEGLLPQPGSESTIAAELKSLLK